MMRVVTVCFETSRVGNMRSSSETSSYWFQKHSPYIIN